MGVKISALPTATEAEAASGLIPVVTDPNGDGNLVTKHVTASSIGSGGANVNTSTTPPSNPSNGDLWFDEGNAELYIYNTAINGWIQTNGGGGGGGGSLVGRAYGRLLSAVVGGITQTATLQEGAFNMTASHAFQEGGRFAVNKNTYTFTFGSTITNPIPIVSPNSIPYTLHINNAGYLGNFSMACTETECTVTITGAKGSGCTCLIL